MRKIVLTVASISLLTFASCDSKKETKSSTEIDRTELPEDALVSEYDISDSSNTTQNSYTVIENNGQQKTVKLDADEQLISANEFPVNAQNLITQNFGNTKILNSLKETEHNVSTFKIQLENGTKVEFAENGEWLEVKNGLNKPIPTNFISEKIINYIVKNYPKAGIEKIKKEVKDGSFKVELLQNNSPTLKFDLNGNFVKID